MKLYETYLAINPDLNEEQAQELVNKVSGWMIQSGFTVSPTGIKPKEWLTYPIKHFRQAHTAVLNISSAEDTVMPPEILNQFKREDNILRHLVLAKSEADLKRTKPLSVMEQLRRAERKTAPAAIESPRATGPKAEEMTPADLEEIDKKLEELLK
ncbi:MAG: 30S ribosomal protein S6 [Parcubacteria group bacterium]|nr:30S ribosomal protein S6 [Parcubacteria group bacterium]